MAANTSVHMSKASRGARELAASGVICGAQADSCSGVLTSRKSQPRLARAGGLFHPRRPFRARPLHPLTVVDETKDCPAIGEEGGPQRDTARCVDEGSRVCDSEGGEQQQAVCEDERERDDGHH